ncbi:hypothetical protein Tco_1542481, partial [Tanacetum coccineum]
MYKEYLAEFWYSTKTLENSKVFFSTPTGGIYGKVGVNTFKNAIGAYYLPHSSEYVAPPSIDIVRLWFETIRYGEVVPAKRTFKKSLFHPRRAKSRIINHDILTRKGPITLKVYREDNTSEIVHEFKASDLHLGEWREVLTTCPNKKGKMWTSIYKQIQERMDYLCKTEAELGIDLDKPLSEQDPLDRL